MRSINGQWPTNPPIGRHQGAARLADLAQRLPQPPEGARSEFSIVSRPVGTAQMQRLPDTGSNVVAVRRAPSEYKAAPCARPAGFLRNNQLFGLNGLPSDPGMFSRIQRGLREMSASTTIVAAYGAIDMT